MVTWQEIQQREKELSEVESQARILLVKKIPQRRYGVGVSTQQQQQVLTQRQQAKTALSQVEQQRSELSTIKNQLREYERSKGEDESYIQQYEYGYRVGIKQRSAGGKTYGYYEKNMSDAARAGARQAESDIREYERRKSELDALNKAGITRKELPDNLKTLTPEQASILERAGLITVEKTTTQVIPKEETIIEPITSPSLIKISKTKPTFKESLVKTFRFFSPIKPTVTKDLKIINAITSVPVIKVNAIPFVTKTQYKSVSQLAFEQKIAREFMSEKIGTFLEKNIPESKPFTYEITPTQKFFKEKVYSPIGGITRGLVSYTGITLPKAETFTTIQGGRKVIIGGAKVIPDIALYSTGLGAIATGSADVLAAQYKVKTGYYEKKAQETFKKQYMETIKTPAPVGYEYTSQEEYLKTAMVSPETKKSLKIQKVFDITLPAVIAGGVGISKLIKLIPPPASEVKFYGVTQQVSPKTIKTDILFGVEKGGKERLGYAEVKTAFRGKITLRGKELEGYISKADIAYLQKNKLFTTGIKFPTGQLFMKPTKFAQGTFMKAFELGGYKGAAIKTSYELPTGGFIDITTEVPKVTASVGGGFTKQSRIIFPTGEKITRVGYEGFSLGARLPKGYTLVKGKIISKLDEEIYSYGLLRFKPSEEIVKYIPKGEISKAGGGLLGLSEKQLQTIVKPAKIIPRANYFNAEEIQTLIQKPIVTTIEREAALQSAERLIRAASVVPSVSAKGLPVSIIGAVKAPVIKSIQVPIKQILIPKVGTKEDTRIIDIVKSAQNQGQVQGNIYKQLTRQINEQVVSQIPIQVPSLIQPQKQTQQQKQRVVQVPITTTTTITRIPRTPMPPPKQSKVPLMFFKIPKLGSGTGGFIKTKGYKSFVIRGGKKRYSPGVYPRGLALRRGEEKVLKTLAATFGVKPTKIKVKATKKDIFYKPSPGIFRAYKIKKGKRVPLRDIYIERRGKRLSFTGEKAEIQLYKRMKGGRRKK